MVPDVEALGIRMLLNECVAMALSRCHAKSASGLRLTHFQAAAMTSRHVVIAGREIVPRNSGANSPWLIARSASQSRRRACEPSPTGAGRPPCCGQGNFMILEEVQCQVHKLIHLTVSAWRLISLQHTSHKILFAPLT